MRDQAPLRIGILETDAPSPELSARHGDYPQMFRQLLVEPGARPPGAPAPGFHTIDVRSGRLPDPMGCDAYLITGSRHSVYDPLPWIAPLAGFVGDALNAGLPVVGICFGHQLLAHHFGGETRRADWRVGVHEAQVVAPACWMQPPARTFRLLVSHQDQVVSLPPGARTFAVSPQCPVAGFVLVRGTGKGRALALQGHPEFTRAYAGELMDMRRESLGERVYREGQASLDERTDAPMVAGWILRFLSAAIEGGER